MGSVSSPDHHAPLPATRWRAVLRRPLVALMVFLAATYAAAALLVGLGVVAQDWNTRVGEGLHAPSAAFPLGTDRLGRSVLRKVVFGARTSLVVALLSSLFSVTAGTTLGLAAGYLGGRVDELIVWLYTTLSVVPGILLMLALAIVLRDATLLGASLRGLPAICLALGLTGWVGVCRLVRGEVIRHKGLDYVTAARAMGCTPARIITAHMLPNLIHLSIIELSLQAVVFIRADVTLSFLGLSATDAPSWGSMIDEARFDMASGAWWQMAAASGAIFGISFAIHTLGDALRDVLDPKLTGAT